MDTQTGTSRDHDAVQLWGAVKIWLPEMILRGGCWGYGCPGVCGRMTDTLAEVVSSWENTNCSRHRLGDLVAFNHQSAKLSRCSKQLVSLALEDLLNHPHRANVSQFAFSHDVPILRRCILPYNNLQGIPYSPNIRPGEVYRKSEVKSSSHTEP